MFLHSLVDCGPPCLNRAGENVRILSLLILSFTILWTLLAICKPHFHYVRQSTPYTHLFTPIRKYILWYCVTVASKKRL